MPDRAEEYRKQAADCLRLANAINDPQQRATLLAMAQRWYQMANEVPRDLNAVLGDFNARQMVGPGRQPKPPKRDDED